MARRRSYRLVTFCCFIILLISFGFGYYINTPDRANNKDNKQVAQNDKSNAGEIEKIEKSNTEEKVNIDNPNHEGGEGEANNEGIIEPVNIDIQKQRITINTRVTFKRNYLKCNHQLTEEVNAPQDLINLTEEELKKLYPNWKVESFGSERVVLSTDVDEQCPNHYIVKEYDGKVGLFYQIPVNGKDFIRDIGNINIEQLRQDDREKLKKGIAVDSDEELAQLLEDFTS